MQQDTCTIVVVMEIVVVMDGSKGWSFLLLLFQDIQLWQPLFPCGINYDMILINYSLGNTVMPSIPFHVFTPIYIVPSEKIPRYLLIPIYRKALYHNS